MAGQEIGALFVKIGADVTGLKTGLTEGAAKVEGFTAKVNSGIASLAKFGAALAVIGVVAVAAGLYEAAKSAANFQTKITQLQTGAGELKGNLKLVSDGILTMTGQVGQSAGALADGMFMIESAGYRGAEALNVLKMAAEGAKVGNASLATVADAVTTVLKDYHMAAGQAGDATNFLVAVVSEGKTHMEDLAGSLAHVLPFASALNIPLDQIGGAMATMTAKGIPAADAATYLRFTMAALANETPKGAKALKEIGLTSSEVSSTLTTKGLLPALQLIQQHLSKEFPKGGAAMFAALANIVGGTRGLGAALQLAGINLTDFIANTASVTDKIKEGHGHIIGWTDVQKDLNFQVQAGEAAFGAVGIKIGTKLLPPITDLLKNVIVPLIPKLADMASTWMNKAVPAVEHFAHWLTTLRPDFQKAYDIITTLKPYLIDVGAAWIAWNVALAVTKALNMASMAIQFVAGLIQIVRTVGLATAGQWLFNVALDANPIGLVVLGLAALAAAFIWAYNNIGPFHDAVNGMWSALQDFGSWAQQVFGPLMGGIGKLLGDIFQGNWGSIGGDIAALHFGIAVAKTSGQAVKASGHSGLQSFDMGGIVPGALGAPTLAVVHGGERVLTPQQQAQGYGGGNSPEVAGLLSAILNELRTPPGGQTGVEAALYKAVHLSGMNRARGMAGA